MINTLAARSRFGKKRGCSYDFEGRLLQILVNFIQIMFNLLLSNVRENMFAFMNKSANIDHFETINFNHSRVASN